MNSIKKQKILENAIYFSLWLIIFCVPFLDNKFSGETSIKWRSVLLSWSAILPFFLLFIINNFFAAPLLFFRKKYWSYLSVILLITVIIFTIYPKIIRPSFPQYRHPVLKENQIGPPAKLPPMPPDDRFFDPGKKMKGRPFFEPRWLDSLFINFLISLLLVGFNLAIKLFIKSIEDEQALRELEKHNLSFELEYLKGQINPHFFMNMLNNIHALVDLDKEKAKETIIGFSRLMRYVLYDANQKTIGLEKEIGFIRNYTELMKIRYTQDVDIKLDLPAIVPDIQIPPLLFISFIENAFKHGVSYRKKSYVDLSVKVDEKWISYQVTNSVWKASRSEETQQAGIGPEGGIGLANVRKRLDLIYGNTYELNIDQTDSQYKVLLLIPSK